MRVSAIKKALRKNWTRGFMPFGKHSEMLSHINVLYSTCMI